ncbi:MAG: NAD-dependent epimerase/dehydratase family protein, partial [Anaerolineales bacterium]
MGNDQDLHVIIGASGGIDSAVTRLLVKRGKSVRAVNRSGEMDFLEGVEFMAADVMDLENTTRACQGAAVVYNCVHPRPGEEYDRFVTMSRNILLATEAAGAKMILAASVYPYGNVDAPMTEDMPQRPVEPTGVLHAKAVDMTIDMHEQGRVRAAIGRSSNYFGPNAGRSYAGDNIFHH